MHIATHAVDDVQHTLGVDADQFTKCVSLAILCSGNKLCFIDCRRCRHREISVSVACLCHPINVHRLFFIRNKSLDLKKRATCRREVALLIYSFLSVILFLISERSFSASSERSPCPLFVSALKRSESSMVSNPS